MKEAVRSNASEPCLLRISKRVQIRAIAIRSIPMQGDSLNINHKCLLAVNPFIYM